MAYGNVVRRACAIGGEACKAACLLAEAWQQFDDDTTSREQVTEAMNDRTCADINLHLSLQGLGLRPEEVLMIGVTGNDVGFADKLDEYDKLSDNPYGWRELPGYNAFFARQGEVEALGRRLADCGDVNFEFKDREGKPVFEFEHGTRTDMFGSNQYAFEKDGEKMSFTEYSLREAIEHYGAEPASIHIKLAAAIQGHNFVKHFDGREKMEEHIPGWYDDGFVKNISNPTWQSGDPMKLEDTWHADSRGMIIRDIKGAMSKS